MAGHGEKLGRKQEDAIAARRARATYSRDCISLAAGMGNRLIETFFNPIGSVVRTQKL
jgi:hypothetical protein